ncbi:exopolysaccharide biosynthesis polyprenyl glycosylphosphotransferase [Bariatricus sp. HCP28S3_E4]|uniref:exopolysaccharide biosynthesis polyprenyl glycosylphosphotransferase n=1 Tax=Lachnospiraceae TaxID=186803 RepID=UPI002A7700A4|nr:exopolysaccharide biosynthesis polyprenyl glycosylphosphotransferase [bacterium]MDY2886843.1 exopolysaccharide biosynthesis polyprenyl glycosylphosphotransferase [Bariatricus sp.]
MERENNLLKKNIVKQSYKIVSLFIMFLSASALWYYNISPYWENGYTGYLTLALVGIMFCIIYWFFAKMYQALKIGIYRLTELMYFQVLAIVLADAALLFESIMWFHGFQKLKIWSYFLGMVFQVVAMGGNIFVHNRLFALYDERRKILIVYGNDGYKTLIKKMQSKKYRYEIVGCYSDETSLEVLEDNIGKAEGIYLYEVDDQLKRKLVLFCDSISKDIYLTQSVEDLLTMGFDVSHTFDTPFIRTKRMPEKWYYAFIKRTIDILFSSMGLIILSPMLLIVAACIKLYDGGPVFYKQIRLTKGHKEFEIYKFRSMIVDAEKNGARLAAQNDNRITPIGKVIRATRVDELPQLINILKGDMTLVGPRPERPEIEDVYLKEIPEFGMRLKVKAGLTGYAQVFGKYNTSPEDKLKLDLLYINQRSLLLDFKLIFYTIKIIFIPEATEGIEENKTTAGSK